MAKTKIYWAGFCCDEVDVESLNDGYNRPVPMVAIFKIKKDALSHYRDVRPVKIVRVKKGD